MNKLSYCLTISRSSLNFRVKLGLIRKLLWTPMEESVSSALGASTRWMRAAWQLSLYSSKLLMTLLMGTSKSGSLHQCSSSKILCLQCGKEGAVRRGSDLGVSFAVCNPCFEKWICYIFCYGDQWCTYLVYPYRCLIMSSSSLSDAIQSSIDFAGLSVDKNGSKNWKKTRLRKLLRLGERNFWDS